MNYLFDNKNKAEQLHALLKEWLHTPYRHWCGVKREGCDCIHFIIRILEEFKYGPFHIPQYARDWNRHNKEELLLNEITKQIINKGSGTFGNKDTPVNGDILLYKFGNTISHVGFFFDAHVYQAINSVGVERIHWKDKTWFKRRRFNLRMVEQCQ